MVDWWKKGSKFALCTRIARLDPVATRVFSQLYYFLLRLFVVPNYPKGGFDVALMDRVMLPYLQKSSKNINIPLFGYWLGFTPHVFHYQRRERQYGRSRWSFGKKVKFFLDSLLGFSIVPIRAISFVGVVVSLLSFGYGTIILVNTLPTAEMCVDLPPSWPSFLFLLGLVIVMLGIIGEYLWRIFDETNKRPETVSRQSIREQCRCFGLNDSLKAFVAAAYWSSLCVFGAFFGQRDRQSGLRQIGEPRYRAKRYFAFGNVRPGRQTDLESWFD